MKRLKLNEKEAEVGPFKKNLLRCKLIKCLNERITNIEIWVWDKEFLLL